MNQITIHIPNQDWILSLVLAVGAINLLVTLMAKRKKNLERQILDELRGIKRELNQLIDIPTCLSVRRLGNSRGDSMNAGQSERFQIVGLNAAGQPVTGFTYSNVSVTSDVGTPTLNPTSDPSIFDFVDPTAGTANLLLAATLTDPTGKAYNLTGTVALSEAVDNVPVSLGLNDLGPTPGSSSTTTSAPLTSQQIAILTANSAISLTSAQANGTPPLTNAQVAALNVAGQPLTPAQATWGKTVS